jgi:hypothetical protein
MARARSLPIGRRMSAEILDIFGTSTFIFSNVPGGSFLLAVTEMPVTV